MKVFYGYGLLICLGMVYTILPSDFCVEKIKSSDLRQEQDLFVRFYTHYCGASDEIGKAVALFEQEKTAYIQAHPAHLFFHATIENDVVGYISCTMCPGYEVIIKQLAVDPDLYDSVLVKELLFAIFSMLPKTKYVSMRCPKACLDMCALLQDLGFKQVSREQSKQVDIFVEYELYVNPKCKICDVLYGDNFWDFDEEQDYIDDAYVDSIAADGFSPAVESM
ncbi:hypothetical protein KBD08_01495 [Candidatus Babeliales bacterium]|nr:hypothetical protein [Candidatus Babeliales bacterium]